MTAKFEAFKAAYEALCAAHDAHISGGCDGELIVYDGPQPTYVELEDGIEVPPTPEEIAAREAEMIAREARWSESHRNSMQILAEAREHETAHLARSSRIYAGWVDIVRESVAHTRNKQMRVSTDPTDPAYIDARPRRAWCNDVLVDGWTVADEFRRCVITADGTVLQGSVLVERLSAAEVEPEAPAAVAPINTGFSGAFVNVPDATKPDDVFMPPPAAPAPTPSAKRRR